jgi:hypothetical protein
MTVVLYGASPPPDEPWRPPVPNVLPAYPFSTGPTLFPCPTCQRHIYSAPCPFCFAEQIAKAPSRAALEAVKKALLDALKLVEEALAK